MFANAPKTAGVYLIRNLVTNGFYIGSACSFARRWREHVTRLRDGTHPNAKLSAAWIEHGPEDWQFEVLEVVADMSNLLAVEQKYLDLYRAAELGYNKRGAAYNSYGVRQSPEAIERVRQALRGRKLTPEHRAAISAGSARHSPTPEHIARIREANTGRPRPDVAQWAPERFRKFTDADIAEIKRMHAAGLRYRAIAGLAGCSLGTLSRILNGKPLYMRAA